jgi:hypothetical protein
MNYYVGDYGLDIILNCNKDITAAVSVAIAYQKPDGTTGSWTGAVYNTTYVKYTTVSGDIDQAGTWKFQALVNGPTPLHGDTASIEFQPLFGPSADFGLSAKTTAATDAEMLVKVNEAITAHLNGGAVQSYTIGGRNLQRTPLMELYKIRDRLERRISQGLGPLTNYARFENPL